MSEAANARTVAAEVLLRVLDDGAWAAPTLDAEIRRQALDKRDAGLTTELVYGVLRTGLFLEDELSKLTPGRTRWRRRVGMRIEMLMAAYQIAFLERVPDHAAVNHAVARMKKKRGTKVAGFVNAVLRRFGRERQAETDRDEALRNAQSKSLPRWLRKQLRKTLGADRVDALLGQTADPLPVSLRLRQGQDPTHWLQTLRQAAPTARFEAGRYVPACIRSFGAGELRSLPGHASEWFVQDEGAQIIALALAVQSGERVLDACAGRGNKTRILTEQVGTGVVDFADLHPKKVAYHRQHCRGPGEGFAVDWTQGSGDFAGKVYDRILLDAPCSGTGTLRRRPEILHQLSASDPTRMAALQSQIIRRVAAHLAPGGTMVYAVCSVLPAECEGVVWQAIEEGLEAVAFDDPLVNELAKGASTLRLLPSEHGCDGFFLAALRRPTDSPLALP